MNEGANENEIDGEVIEPKADESTPQEPATIDSCAACGKPFKRELNKRGRPATKCNACRALKSARKTATAIDLSTLPVEVLEFASLAPLILAGEIVRVKSGGIVLQYSPQSVAAIKTAFAAWLKSIDIDLTPGWALLACYTIAVSTAIPGAMQAYGEKQAKAEKSDGNSDKKQPSAEPDTTPKV